MVFVFGALVEYSIVNVLARRDQLRQGRQRRRVTGADTRVTGSVAGTERKTKSTKLDTEPKTISFDEADSELVVLPDVLLLNTMSCAFLYHMHTCAHCKLPTLSVRALHGPWLLWLVL